MSPVYPNSTERGKRGDYQLSFRTCDPIQEEEAKARRELANPFY
ncbi:hypothetical protein [Aeromonas phage Asp37]|nr:hypothetical protein [Aeromonas phage Asp37]